MIAESQVPPLTRCVFVAGATGYMGRVLVSRLLARGHQVRALARSGSEGKLPAGCVPVVGNALEESTYAAQVTPADTFVHLVGVPHPNPSKAAQFRAVDLPAFKASLAAARTARVQHFVYVSVAQPAPVMKAYLTVLQECENLLRASGLNATILRPWYVLGPGHRWPYLLIPIYRLFELVPATREGAQRLGLVRLSEMVAALAQAVEHPAPGMRVLGVLEIRAAGTHHNSTASTAAAL
jgi:uncharacterized protein YbjT (DUF2867 family)